MLVVGDTVGGGLGAGVGSVVVGSVVVGSVVVGARLGATRRQQPTWSKSQICRKLTKMIHRYTGRLSEKIVKTFSK